MVRRSLPSEIKQLEERIAATASFLFYEDGSVCYVLDKYHQARKVGPPCVVIRERKTQALSVGDVPGSETANYDKPNDDWLLAAIGVYQSGFIDSFSPTDPKTSRRLFDA